MAELTTGQRDILIRLCKQRVEANGMAVIHRVSQDHKTDIGIDAGIDFPQAERVSHFIVQHDGRYEAFKSENGHAIKINQSYELSESVKTTNTAVQESFISQKRLARWSLILTGISIAFIGITALIQWSDQTPKEVQSLKQQVQKSSQSLDSIAAYLREVNSSRRNVDTVYLINPAPAKDKKSS
jgi:hypothetical protein